MSELKHQIALFNWAALAQVQHPELEFMFAIPNGGARDAVTGNNLKKSGVKRGVPDLCLPVARHGFHGLYIELKVDKRKPSKEQLTYIKFLTEQGYCVATCWNWIAAKDQLEAYLCN